MLVIMNQIKNSILVVGLCLIVLNLQAEPKEASGYNQPPQKLLNIMRAPAPPYPMVSPARDQIGRAHV